MFSGSHAVIVFAVLFLVLLTLENMVPLRRRKYGLARRFGINVIMSVSVFAVGALAVKPLSMRLIGWTSERSFGLVHLLPLSASARFFLGFLLMDLAFYYWHRINHLIPLLWRFHRVHHVDPDLDVTTAFRFHPVEVLYSTLFRVFQVVLIGVTPAIYIIYEFVFTCSTIFHHSNVRFPAVLERILNWVLVTPRVHGIHHDHRMEFSVSNCSTIFLWWDRLHRTSRLNTPQDELTIGVGGLLEWKHNTLWSLVTLPFRKE